MSNEAPESLPIVRCPGCEEPMDPKGAAPVTRELDDISYVCQERRRDEAHDETSIAHPGAESVFLWTKDKKGVDRRGAGPVDGKLLGRGSGEGFGVHICTVRGGELGDILEVRIMDVKPRPCVNPAYAGKAFGSNAAAWWGTSSPNRNPAKSSRFTRSTRPDSETRPPRPALGASCQCPQRFSSWAEISM